MNVAKTLREAAEYIRAHGWTQRMYQRANGNVCMLGATAAVLYGDAGAGAPDAIYNALEPVVGPSVIGFNDGMCESADDAIAALEIAADIAERKGI